MKIKKFSIFSFFLLLVFSLVSAQTGEVGTFVGTVSDEEGESLPGVEVTARNIETGLTQSTVTNVSGRYRLERLPRGFYELTAKLAGFKTTIRKGLELHGGAQATVPLKLELGTLEEEVTVIAVTPLIETTRTEVSTVFTEKELLAYPQANRNYMNLMAYAPGTQPNAPTLGGDGYAINGMRGESNNYMIDGMNNNDMTDNTMETTMLPVEAIQEFRLITNNFNAEYGRTSGGVLNVVMRSGTNDMHGSAWGFYRGGGGFFRSADWLTNERPPLNRYQFGATLGGPIVKDKTFFFGTFEISKQEMDQVTSQFFLTPDAIATAVGPAKQFFDKYQSAYPVPTYDFSDKNGDGIADYGRAAMSYTDSYKAISVGIKLDHIFNEKDRVAFRWIYNFREDKAGFDYYWLPGEQVVRPTQFHTGGMTWLHIFSPTMYNEVRLGYHRDNWEWETNDESITYFSFDDELLGFGDTGYPMTQINSTYQLADVLNMQLGDHNIKTGGEFRLWNVNSSFDALVNGYYIYDSGIEFLANAPVSYMILGADPPDNKENPYLPGDPTGEWKTGFGLTDRKWKGFEIGLFAQDDWRVSDRLTFSFGLRWEFYSVPDEYSGVGINQPAFGTQQGFLNNEMIEGVWNDEGITYTIFDGRQIMGKGLWNNYFGNFGPKVSFAYDLTGDGMTALRAGYGISYDRQMNRSYENDRFNYPDFAFNSFTGTPWGGTADFYAQMPGNVVPVEAAGDVRISLRWMDPNLRPQMAHNWMIGIQREITPVFSIEVDYTGSAGRKIGAIIRLNRLTGDAADGTYDGLNPYISIRDGNYRTNSFYSNYHGAQLILTKRFSGGWSWYTSYTFSVSKDLNSLYQGIALSQGIEESVWDIDYHYSEYDHRHRIVGGLVWEVPFFRDSESWMLKNLVGGWQLGVSYHFTSGTHFGIFTGSGPDQDYNMDGQWGSDRPLWLGGDNYNEAIKWNAGRPYVDSSLFAAPNPPTAPGDLTYYDQNITDRNAFTWDPTYNIDISLQKSMIVPGGKRDYTVTLILDVFNLLHSQFWQFPSMTYGNANFGVSSRMIGDRIAQLSVRFMF